jgi:hypothetical protein
MRAGVGGALGRAWLVWLVAALACTPEAEPSPSAPSIEPVGSPQPTPAPEPWSEAWLAQEAGRYLDEPEFRRAQLLASLTNPDNLYGQTRIGAYGLEDRGWDTLPEWVPATAPITNATVAALRAGESLPDPSAILWDGQRPSDLAGWVALGQRVFDEYPLRPEIFALHALANPALAAEVGLLAAGPEPDARWPGVVRFVDLDGEVRVGITCAVCHVGPDSSGALIPGRARRSFDYGRMRLALYEDTGAELSPELAARMARWGPGRADITDDDDEDPVAIPDLWAIRELSHLTQSATLTHAHPAALAIRQETQLLHANREQARPPRELAWALAMYVYSLAPPARPPPEATAETEAGRALFADRCAGCHSGVSGAGEPIPAARVGTHPALAHGYARGTGLYRPAPLVRVGEAGPYLHDGSVATLEALLDPDRLARVPGHRFGSSASPEQRAALIAYLRTR